MTWKYREVAIEDDKSIGDSGTETIDINVKDPITALIVRFKAQNYSSGVVENEAPERQISKLEIVDGGTTHWSLDGEKAVAAAAYGLGRWPHHWYDERASSNQRCNFPILFGRYLGDEEYAFNPSALLNPQLKITWTDQAKYTDDSLTLGVTARAMEGLSPPGKCLMWKEIEAWTTTSGVVKSVGLPVDYPYRSLMMRPFLDGTIPSSIWTNFKLDCDLGKYIPFDLASHEFRDVIKQTDGPFHLRKFVYGDTGNYKYAMLGETFSVFGSPNTVGMVFSWSSWASQFTFSVCDHAGTAIDNATGQMLISGLFPHRCYLYRFGRKDIPETWFNAPEYGEIKLKLTEGTSSAAGSVAVQQPIRL